MATQEAAGEGAAAGSSLNVMTERINAYSGPEPFAAPTAAEILTGAGLEVTPRTVTNWATSGQLSGFLAARVMGWRFTRGDLIRYIEKRFAPAVNR